MIRRATVVAIIASIAVAPQIANAAPKRPVSLPQHPVTSIDGTSRTSPVDGVGPLGEVWRVPMRRKEIALTFDDGPYPFYTDLLLHELERSHAVATFFLVGRSSQEFPELVKRIVADDDEVGDHTFNHYKLTKLSGPQIAAQISEDATLLEPFVGAPLKLFRPPHGRFDHRVVALAHAMGYDTIFWSDSPEDTKDISPALVVKRTLDQATPGGIILMHNGQYRTIEALPIIIDRLRSEGYTFVTVTRLLEDGRRYDGLNVKATPFMQ
ncbi:MAG TPA: polysaccharide deacetylase family protein [Candidatus Eremiobacteraceae bacterium]|nr:polysaccharide deacetylase family protein [Candidatus Eremiobacteraceae bacterium]